MAEATIQTLKIKIRYDFGRIDAKQKIDDINNALRNLMNTVRGLSSLNGLNFSKFKNNIHDIVKDIEKLDSVRKIYDLARQVSSNDTAEKILSNKTMVDGKEVSLVDQITGKINSKLDQILTKTDTGNSHLKKASENTKKIKREVNKTHKEFSIFSNKLFKSIGRITFYRMVRRGLQLVTQGIVDGINALSVFDKEFNATMSELKSSYVYLKSSLGTMIAPFIQALTPLITTLVDKFVSLGNAISEVFAKMRGNDTFIKAKKTVEDYANSVKKANNTLGIDELNVLSGSETDPNDRYEIAEVSDKYTALADAITKIEGVFSTIWEYVSSLANKLTSSLSGLFFNSSFLDSLVGIFSNIGNIIESITPILSMFIGLLSNAIPIVTQLLGNITENIAKVIAFISPYIEKFIADLQSWGMDDKIKTIVKNIMTLVSNIIDITNTTLKPLLDILEPILAGITYIITDITEFITTVLVNLTTALKETIFNDEWWKQVGQVLVNLWNSFISFWKDTVFGNIKKAFIELGNVFENLWKKVKGIWDNIVSFFSNIWNTIKGIGDKIASWFGGLFGSSGENKSWIGSLWDKVVGRANGGFVDNATLFYANENGVPEMIGQMGNRTAVANNNQITEGIYQAVLQAMQDSNINTSNNVKVYLDSKEIAFRVEERQNERGAKIYKGGMINAY